LRERLPSTPVIIMTAYSDLDSAVAAFQGGAFEYLPKPFDVDHAVELVRRAIEESRRQVEALPADTQAPEILGQAPAMQEVFRAIGRLAQSHATVMITGESGTGKELVARALHRHSPRASKAFIAINTAAIPKELLESELFGHERGAFTGAQATRRGRFEQAEGGTLFLDEIGDMPMEAQTRLLRVLQEGEYTMVGGRTAIKANVRIVAATHRDLNQMIRQGLFREDLYYRLNVVPIRLPPLRERVDDIADLVAHFLRQAQQEGEPPKSIAPAAIKLMQAHGWPGNVRELENLVRRLAALYADETISAEIVENELRVAERPALPGSVGIPVDISAAVESHVAQLLREAAPNLPPAGLYQRVLERVEAPLIAMALNACGGNQIRAADLLGLNRNTLRKKLRAHNIEIVKQSRRNG
jgi:two-component system, NtrC family, nitrogen regulation response regulator GlnG